MFYLTFGYLTIWQWFSLGLGRGDFKEICMINDFWDAYINKR